MTAKPPSGRKVLIATLTALGAIPVASGAVGVLLGPSGIAGGEITGSTVDSEYRFVNTFWLAAGIALWWSLREPESRARTTRTMLALAGLGAGPRLLSWAKRGAPHPSMRAALALELVVVPIILWWHGRVFPSAVRTSR